MNDDHDNAITDKEVLAKFTIPDVLKPCPFCDKWNDNDVIEQPTQDGRWLVPIVCCDGCNVECCIQVWEADRPYEAEIATLTAALTAARSQLAEARGALKNSTKHLEAWLAMDECDCDTATHICGKPKVQGAVNAARRILSTPGDGAEEEGRDVG